MSKNKNTLVDLRFYCRVCHINSFSFNADPPAIIFSSELSPSQQQRSDPSTSAPPSVYNDDEVHASSSEEQERLMWRSNLMNDVASPPMTPREAINAGPMAFVLDENF